MTKRRKKIYIPALERLAKKQGEDKVKSILLFDIETSPMTFTGWRTGQQYVAPEQILEDWSILSWCAKWAGSPDMISDASWLHGTDVRDDKAVCKSLHKLVDKADVVVAHNGRGFDVKKINSRFIINGFGPPKPYKTVDTLQISRSVFGFSSNKLDEIGKALGIGRKVEHEGRELWLKVVAGDQDAQNRMLDYNAGDVVLLEQIYAALLPWDNRHPNVNLDFDVLRCSVCSCKNLRQRGEVYTPVNSYCAYQCVKCGHWMRGTSATRDKDDRALVGRNVV